METKRLINKTRSAAALAVVTFIGAGAAAAQLQTTVNNFSIDMNRPSGSCASFAQVITAASGNVCTLSGSGGLFEGGGENGSVGLENGVWVFRGSSCQPGVRFNVTCFRST